MSPVRPHGPIVAVALLLIALPSRAAIEVPECDALAEWAATLDPQATYPVSPALSLPEAFSPEIVESLFGLAPLDWTGDDVLAARQALNACRQQARRGGEAERAQALSGANGALARRLRNVVRSVRRARSTVEEQLDAIDALTADADRAQAVQILTAADPARPRSLSGDLRALDRAVRRPFSRLAGALPDLPAPERERLFATLRERYGSQLAEAGDTAAQETASQETASQDAGTREPTAPDAPALAGGAQAAPRQAAATAPAHTAGGAPSCDALAAWAATLEPEATFSVTPSHALPEAFSPQRLEPVFGRPALEWTGDHVAAAREAINACRGQARRAGDEPRAAALASANQHIARDLRAVVRGAARARRAVAEQREVIAALPGSLDVARAIRALAGVDPADTRAAYAALGEVDRDVWKPFTALAKALPALPHAEREALFGALAEQRRGIEEAMIAEVREALDAAPDTAAGVLVLERQRLRLGAMEAAGAPDAGALREDLETRLVDLRAQLRDAAAPTWVPPTCEQLYAWGGAPDALDFARLGAGGVRRAFADDRVQPLFGKPLAAWTEQEVEHFDTLGELCRARVQALAGSDRVPRSPGPDAPELVRLAAAGRWVDAAGRELREARATLAAHREALAELAALRERIEALPAAAAALDELSRLQRAAVLARVSHAERAEFGRFVAEHRERILRGVEAAAVAALEAVAVQAPADLGRLWTLGRRERRPLSGASSQRFERRFRARMAASAQQVLPQFRERIDRMPATAQGLQQLEGALEALTGVPEQGWPSLPGYPEAVAQRAQAVAGTLARQRCDALWARIDLDRDDAGRAVWDGAEGTTVGALVCDLAEQGHTVSGFEGPGLLSDTATLEVTLEGQPFQRIRLHEGEVAPDTRMLVGFEVKDANETRSLSVTEWERFVAASAGGETDCRRLLATPAQRLSAEQRMDALGCVLGEAARRMQQP